MLHIEEVEEIKSAAKGLGKRNKSMDRLKPADIQNIYSKRVNGGFRPSMYGSGIRDDTSMHSGQGFVRKGNQSMTIERRHMRRNKSNFNVSASKKSEVVQSQDFSGYKHKRPIPVKK